jgi:hypothetical protein
LGVELFLCNVVVETFVEECPASGPVDNDFRLREFLLDQPGDEIRKIISGTVTVADKKNPEVVLPGQSVAAQRQQGRT